MFSKWLWIFIIGIHSIGIVILSLYLFRERKRTYSKFTDSQKVDEQKKKIGQKKKRLVGSLKFFKVFYNFILIMTFIAGIYGCVFFLTPAVRDIPYVRSQDYLSFEGEIIYNDGTAVTLENKKSGKQKHFRLSLNRPVGSHIKVSYLPHTKIAECRVN